MATGAIQVRCGPGATIANCRLGEEKLSTWSWEEGQFDELNPVNLPADDDGFLIGLGGLLDSMLRNRCLVGCSWRYVQPQAELITFVREAGWLYGKAIADEVEAVAAMSRVERGPPPENSYFDGS